MRKILALVLAVCMVLALTACGTSASDAPEADPSPKVTELPEESDNPDNSKPVSTATSKDAQLYRVPAQKGADAYVVNAYGMDAEGYSVDEDGAIRSADGTVVVRAENAADFILVTDLSFKSSSIKVTLDAKEQIVGGDPNVTTVTQNAVNCSAELALKQNDATCRVLVISSDNPDVAEVLVGNNKNLLAEGSFDLENGELAIEVPTSGEAEIVVTAKKAGVATLTVESLAGTAVAKCSVDVRNGSVSVSDKDRETNSATGVDNAPGAVNGVGTVVNASGDPTKHVHSYTKVEVEATQFERGHTLYTCDCGYSYKDNFTPMKPAAPAEETHTHNYVDSVVAPTETEQGYTQHTCSCGDTYRDCFVEALGK